MEISNDQHSEASSISTRASSTHTDTSGRDDEQDDNLVKRIQQIHHQILYSVIIIYHHRTIWEDLK